MLRAWAISFSQHRIAEEDWVADSCRHRSAASRTVKIDLEWTALVMAEVIESSGTTPALIGFPSVVDLPVAREICAKARRNAIWAFIVTDLCCIATAVLVKDPFAAGENFECVMGQRILIAATYISCSTNFK